MCAITKEELLEAVPVPVKSTPPALPQDSLAFLTYKQKQAVESVYSALERLSSHPACRVMIRTTQPAHLVAVAAVTCVASMMAAPPQMTTTLRPSPTLNMLYLASISIHIGTQFWMTFISGLALYFSLPRHAFGDVQKVLFPKYFTLNTFLSGITLVTFARLHRDLNQWQTRHWVQMWSMSTCFLVELLIRLYAVPVVLELITAKTEIEKRVPGVGEEIGCHAPGRLAGCPHYVKLHKAFRKNHLVVALGNITTMVCTTLQLHYIHQNWSCLV